MVPRSPGPITTPILFADVPTSITSATEQPARRRALHGRGGSVAGGEAAFTPHALVTKFGSLEPEARACWEAGTAGLHKRLPKSHAGRAGA